MPSFFYTATKVGFEELVYKLEEGGFTTIGITFDMKLEKSININYLIESATSFGEFWQVFGK